MSSGVSFEELSILLLLLLSVLGYRGFPGHVDYYRFLLFLSSCSFFYDPPFLEGLSHYILLSSRS